MAASLTEPLVGPRVTRLGEDSLLFHFAATHCKVPALALQQRLWALTQHLEEHRAALGLIEIVPGMGNLLLQFALSPGPQALTQTALSEQALSEQAPSGQALAGAAQSTEGELPARDHAGLSLRGDTLTAHILTLWPTLPQADKAGRTIDIPVVYGGESGPDLQVVAAHSGLTVSEVIARHSARCYRVFCLGFQPGFAYLGGLDPALATPRRTTPRVTTPAGSVAIGGGQTGVYPSAAPSGWQIIGHTTASLFDPLSERPALLLPGDTVRFVAVGGIP